MPIGFESTVELAETIGASVFDINKRLGFPNRHPLSVSFHSDAFKGVDLVAALDVVDWTRGSHKLNTQTREISVVTAPDCKWIDIGFADIEISKWATDYNKHHNWDHRSAGRQRTDDSRPSPPLAASGSTAIRLSPRSHRGAQKKHRRKARTPVAKMAGPGQRTVGRATHG